MNRYVYSDPHFNHANIIQMQSRPFSSVEEMNAHMITEFNSVVKPGDKVYLLGDVGMGDIKSIIANLNGYKILIMGNHDRRHSRAFWLDAGFDEVHKDPILIQKQFILSHEPLLMSEDMPYLNIHGHTHSLTLESKKHINISVEQTQYKPILLNSIIRRWKKGEL